MGAGRLTFEVPGAPVPKARPRRAKYGGVYTPRRTRDYEAKVAGYALKARAEAGWKRLSGPVGIEIRIRGARNSDIDNIAKAIADSLNRIAYDDDRQIQEMTVVREAGDDGVTITVWAEEGADDG